MSVVKKRHVKVRKGTPVEVMVEAIDFGYYDNRVRRPGEKFLYKGFFKDGKPAAWFVVAEGAKVKKVAPEKALAPSAALEKEAAAAEAPAPVAEVSAESMI